MEEIKRRCIEHGIQLVDTPTMHLGTDGSRKLYTMLVDHLLEKGVEFAIEREVEELIIEDGKIKGAVVSHKGEKETYYSDNIVLGMGRSGAHKVMDLCQKHGVNYQDGAIDIGVRVEIPDIIMKEINENFYEAKMIYYTKTYNDKMRTFCSNPSGFIAAEKHADDVILANGHAYKDKKSTNTNLALLCTKTFTKPFDQPFEYATAIANLSSMLTGGKLLMQSYGDLKVGKRSTDEKLERLNIIPTTTDYVAGDISLPKNFDNIMEFIRHMILRDLRQLIFFPS
ncbi:MAG: NAD(P)/FAD-dependent oxidoreductase [Fusobacterium sp.]